MHAIRISLAFLPFSDNSFEARVGPRGVSNDNYSYERVIAHRQPETMIFLWKTDPRKERRGRPPVSLPDLVNERIRGTYPAGSLYFAEVLPDIPRTWCSVRRLG